MDDSAILGAADDSLQDAGVPPRLAGLLEQARTGFRQAFGKEPDGFGFAPGRINLIGEHTDYNLGLAMPMAVDRYVVVATGKRDSRGADEAGLRIGSDRFSGLHHLGRLSSPEQVPAGWLRYVAGVKHGLELLGCDCDAVDACVRSDLPAGAGLSSSAALEVSLACALTGLRGIRLEKLELARLCQRAEQQFAGVPCGLMDQLTVVLARQDHLMQIDFRDESIRQRGLDAGVSIVVVPSGVQHALAGSEYALRRAESAAAARAFGASSLREVSLEQLRSDAGLEPLLRRRARHVIEENQRVLLAGEAMEKGAWDELGRLLYASHESLRIDYEVSCRELDELVRLAAGLGPAHGVRGARMTGGGFGGSIVVLAETAKLQAIESRFRASLPAGLPPHLMVFSSRPQAGGGYLAAGGSPGGGG